LAAVLIPFWWMEEEEEEKKTNPDYYIPAEERERKKQTYWLSFRLSLFFFSFRLPSAFVPLLPFFIFVYYFSTSFIFLFSPRPV
jgi:hypothetical protein